MDEEMDDSLGDVDPHIGLDSSCDVSRTEVQEPVNADLDTRQNARESTTEAYPDQPLDITMLKDMLLEIRTSFEDAALKLAKIQEEKDSDSTRALELQRQQQRQLDYLNETVHDMKGQLSSLTSTVNDLKDVHDQLKEQHNSSPRKIESTGKKDNKVEDEMVIPEEEWRDASVLELMNPEDDHPETQVDSKPANNVTEIVSKSLSMIQSLQKKFEESPAHSSDEDDEFRSRRISHYVPKSRSMLETAKNRRHSLPAKAVLTKAIENSSAAQRQKAVTDLADEERKYCSQLWSLIHTYLSPLQTSGYLSTRELSLLFPAYLDQLYTEHCRVCSGLQDRLVHWTHISTVADLIASITDTQDQESVLGLYKDYSEDVSATVTCLKKVLNTSRDVKSLIQDIKESAGQSEDLHSLILRPVQRLPNFLSQLQEIVDHTPATHPDYPLLHSAISRLHKFITSQLNLNLANSLQDIGSRSSGDNSHASKALDSGVNSTEEDRVSTNGISKMDRRYRSETLEDSFGDLPYCFEYEGRQLCASTTRLNALSQPDLTRFGTMSNPRNLQMFRSRSTLPYGGNAMPGEPVQAPRQYKKFKVKKRTVSPSYANRNSVEQLNQFVTSPTSRPSSAIDFLQRPNHQYHLQHHNYHPAPRPHSVMSGIDPYYRPTIISRKQTIPQSQNTVPAGSYWRDDDGNIHILPKRNRTFHGDVLPSRIETFQNSNSFDNEDFEDDTRASDPQSTGSYPYTGSHTSNEGAEEDLNVAHLEHDQSSEEFSSHEIAASLALKLNLDKTYALSGENRQNSSQNVPGKNPRISKNKSKDVRNHINGISKLEEISSDGYHQSETRKVGLSVLPNSTYTLLHSNLVESSPEITEVKQNDKVKEAKSNEDPDLISSSRAGDNQIDSPETSLVDAISKSLQKRNSTLTENQDTTANKREDNLKKNLNNRDYLLSLAQGSSKNKWKDSPSVKSQTLSTSSSVFTANEPIQMSSPLTFKETDFSVDKNVVTNTVSSVTSSKPETSTKTDFTPRNQLTKQKISTVSLTSTCTIPYETSIDDSPLNQTGNGSFQSLPPSDRKREERRKVKEGRYYPAEDLTKREEDPLSARKKMHIKSSFKNFFSKKRGCVILADVEKEVMKELVSSAKKSVSNNNETSVNNQIESKENSSLNSSTNDSIITVKLRKDQGCSTSSPMKVSKHFHGLIGKQTFGKISKFNKKSNKRNKTYSKGNHIKPEEQGENTQISSLEEKPLQSLNMSSSLNVSTTENYPCVTYPVDTDVRLRHLQERSKQIEETLNNLSKEKDTSNETRPAPKDENFGTTQIHLNETVLVRPVVKRKHCSCVSKWRTDIQSVKTNGSPNRNSSFKDNTKEDTKIKAVDSYKEKSKVTKQLPVSTKAKDKKFQEKDKDLQFKKFDKYLNENGKSPEKDKKEKRFSRELNPEEIRSKVWKEYACRKICQDCFLLGENSFNAEKNSLKKSQVKSRIQKPPLSSDFSNMSVLGAITSYQIKEKTPTFTDQQLRQGFESIYPAESNQNSLMVRSYPTTLNDGLGLQNDMNFQESNISIPQGSKEIEKQTQIKSLPKNADRLRSVKVNQSSIQNPLLVGNSQTKQRENTSKVDTHNLVLNTATPIRDALPTSSRCNDLSRRSPNFSHSYCPKLTSSSTPPMATSSPYITRTETKTSMKEASHKIVQEHPQPLCGVTSRNEDKQPIKVPVDGDSSSEQLSLSASIIDSRCTSSKNTCGDIKGSDENFHSSNTDAKIIPDNNVTNLEGGSSLKTFIITEKSTPTKMFHLRFDSNNPQCSPVCTPTQTSTNTPLTLSPQDHSKSEAISVQPNTFDDASVTLKNGLPFLKNVDFLNNDTSIQEKSHSKEELLITESDVSTLQISNETLINSQFCQQNIKIATNDDKLLFDNKSSTSPESIKRKYRIYYDDRSDISKDSPESINKSKDNSPIFCDVPEVSLNQNQKTEFAMNPSVNIDLHESETNRLTPQKQKLKYTDSGSIKKDTFSIPHCNNNTSVQNSVSMKCASASNIKDYSYNEEYLTKSKCISYEQSRKIKSDSFISNKDEHTDFHRLNLENYKVKPKETIPPSPETRKETEIPLFDNIKNCKANVEYQSEHHVFNSPSHKNLNNSVSKCETTTHLSSCYKNGNKCFLHPLICQKSSNEQSKAKPCTSTSNDLCQSIDYSYSNNQTKTSSSPSSINDFSQSPSVFSVLPYNDYVVRRSYDLSKYSLPDSRRKSHTSTRSKDNDKRRFGCVFDDYFSCENLKTDKYTHEACFESKTHGHKKEAESKQKNQMFNSKIHENDLNISSNLNRPISCPDSKIRQILQKCADSAKNIDSFSKETSTQTTKKLIQTTAHAQLCQPVNFSTYSRSAGTFCCSDQYVILRRQTKDSVAASSNFQTLTVSTGPSSVMSPNLSSSAGPDLLSDHLPDDTANERRFSLPSRKALSFLVRLTQSFFSRETKPATSSSK